MVQAALQKIGFLLGDHEAGALVQQLRDVFEVIHIHAADLITNLRTLGPISRSGRTAEHSPLVATAPGMPPTTLVASSCATTVPPAAPASAAPARQRVVSGQSVSVRVDLGGRRLLKNKKTNIIYIYTHY